MEDPGQLDVTPEGVRRIAAQLDYVWTDYVDDDIHDLAVDARRSLTKLADRLQGAAAPECAETSPRPHVGRLLGLLEHGRRFGNHSIVVTVDDLAAVLADLGAVTD